MKNANGIFLDTNNNNQPDILVELVSSLLKQENYGRNLSARHKTFIRFRGMNHNA